MGFISWKGASLFNEGTGKVVLFLRLMGFIFKLQFQDVGGAPPPPRRTMGNPMTGSIVLK